MESTRVSTLEAKIVTKMISSRVLGARRQDEWMSYNTYHGVVGRKERLDDQKNIKMMTVSDHLG